MFFELEKQRNPKESSLYFIHQLQSLMIQMQSNSKIQLCLDILVYRTETIILQRIPCLQTTNTGYLLRSLQKIHLEDVMTFCTEHLNITEQATCAC